MKTSSALAFVLLTLVAIAVAPAPTELAPEPALSSPAPADPAGIEAPAPLSKANSCFTECYAIRRECDAGCTFDACHRECRDSAIACLSQC